MNLIYLVIIFVLILISMTIHEFSHAYVAYLLGDETAKIEGRLTLNPIKHLDPFMSVLLPFSLALMGLPIFGGAKPVSLNYRKIKWGDSGLALVALAGPASNFIMAFLAFGISSFVSNLVVVYYLKLFVFMNLGFMLFNLIPIPPLDGSRVLYLFFSQSSKEFMIKIEKYGIFIIFVLILSGNFIGVYINQVSNIIIDFFSLIFRI